MLQLVTKALSSNTQGKKKRERAIVRRAIFVCNHPEAGWSVLDRSFFVRRFIPGSNLDECKKNGNLYTKVGKTLSFLFRNHGVSVESRGEMFQMRGLTEQVLELTPFVFDFTFSASYEQIPTERCIALDAHPMRHEIRKALSAFFKQQTEESLPKVARA